MTEQRKDVRVPLNTRVSPDAFEVVRRAAEERRVPLPSPSLPPWRFKPGSWA